MKKGFTLVELLAIIVILAVISLITYAVIQKNIDVTKRSSFETSVKNLIEAAKEYVITNYEENDFPEGGIDIANDELNIKNSEFISGIIMKDKQGQIIVENLSDGRLCANGTKNSLEITDVVNGLCDESDDTPPTLEVKVLKNTSSKVRFLIKMQDAQSGLKGLSYCYGDCSNSINLEIDDPSQRKILKKVIEVDNLMAGETYNFKFTLTNNIDSSDNSKTTTVIEKEVEILEVEEPIFKVSSGSYATTKHVKIIYPELDEYDYSYYTNNNSENVVTIEKGKYETEFDINDNTKVTAIISKDGKEIISSELNITGLDTDPPVTYVYIHDYNKWTLSKNVYVKSEDNGSGLALRGYSLDNKKNWKKTDGNNIVTALKDNQAFTLKSRDKVGNIQEEFSVCNDLKFEHCGDSNTEYPITKIDNVPPNIDIKVVNGVLGSNSWYTSNTVTIEVRIYDQASEIVNGKKQIIRGGIGVGTRRPVITINGKSISYNSQTTNDEFIAKFDVTENGDNNINVSAQDNLENETSKQKLIKKDDVIPSVECNTMIGNDRNWLDIGTNPNTIAKPKTGVSGLKSFSCDLNSIDMDSRTTNCDVRNQAGVLTTTECKYGVKYNGTSCIYTYETEVKHETWCKDSDCKPNCNDCNHDYWYSTETVSETRYICRGITDCSKAQKGKTCHLY